jgi:hypothetical protein
MDERDPPPIGIEPPLIARARRVGWALLLLSLVAAGTYRLSAGMIASVALVVALTLALFGLLAIGNVMLVRALYRQIDVAADKPQPPQR